jgi:hypothetical protein
VDTTVIVLIIVIVVLALAVGGWVLARQRRSQRLQEHYGDEYERSVRETGDRRAAEAALTEREARVREFDIRELRDEERTGYTDRWASVQRDFVDDPAKALHDADALVVEVMRTRGYPTDSDFDRRAEDLSVEHPKVVRHYREARAVRDAKGSVDTEQQRHALTSYRSLVEELLGKTSTTDRHDGDDHRADRAEDRAEDHTEDRTAAHRADTTATTEEQPTR